MDRLDRAIVRLNAALHYAAALWLLPRRARGEDAARRAARRDPAAGYEGSLRIPVYPVRTLVVAMAGLAMLNYLTMAFLAAARREARAVP